MKKWIKRILVAYVIFLTWDYVNVTYLGAEPLPFWFRQLHTALWTNVGFFLIYFYLPLLAFRMIKRLIASAGAKPQPHQQLDKPEEVSSERLAYLLDSYPQLSVEGCLKLEKMLVQLGYSEGNSPQKAACP